MTRHVTLAAAVMATVATAVVAANVTPAARASDATPAQVAALAARAGDDAQSLAELRDVDRIGGRSVDLAAALDADGPELDERLHALAASVRAGASGEPAGDPRAAAEAILAERRFTGSDVPRPLHRPLEWLGRKLHSLYDSAAGWIPGGPELLWVLVAAAVVGVAALAATRLGRGRGGLLVEGGGGRTRMRSESPRELEREADEAERAGDFERALRLRFRAGLLRLAGSEAIPQRHSLTNGEIARQLDSQSFRLLVSDFDEVVYGDRPAGGDDVQRARTAWPRVLDEAGRR